MLSSVNWEDITMESTSQTKIMAGQPTPPDVETLRNKGLIAGLAKGNQWLIGPDHKALSLGGYLFFWGGAGGVGENH